MQFFIANTETVFTSSARVADSARLIDLRQRRDFVRNGQIDSNEIEFAQERQRRSQFVWRETLKTAPYCMSISQARRRRFAFAANSECRNRITKNAEP